MAREHEDGRETLLIDAAARRLGVSRRTIYYRIRDGQLRTIRTIGGSQRVLAWSLEELRLAREKEQRRRALSAKRPDGSDAEALSLQVEAFS